VITDQENNIEVRYNLLCSKWMQMVSPLVFGGCPIWISHDTDYVDKFLCGFPMSLQPCAEILILNYIKASAAIHILLNSFFIIILPFKSV
jgi:hypothetical protein